MSHIEETAAPRTIQKNTYIGAQIIEISFSFFTQSIFKENLNKYHRAGRQHVIPHCTVCLLVSVAGNCSKYASLIRSTAVAIICIFYPFALFCVSSVFVLKFISQKKQQKEILSTHGWWFSGGNNEIDRYTYRDVDKLHLISLSLHSFFMKYTYLQII